VKRFGAKRLAQVIEENHSMELIENTSKQCPHCKSWMQVSSCIKTIYKLKYYFIEIGWL
jgi:ribosomal protein L37AE/L43A